MGAGAHGVQTASCGDRSPDRWERRAGVRVDLLGVKPERGAAQGGLSSQPPWATGGAEGGREAASGDVVLAPGEKERRLRAPRG